MKKISKKRLSVCLSFMLCISMLFSIGSVFAADNSNEEYTTTTYSAEEITDVNEIIDLALDAPIAYLANSIDENDISYNQLLERRVYLDGAIEETFSQSTVNVLDANGQIVPRANVDANGSVSGNNSSYGNSASITLNFTKRFNPDIPAGGTKYRINSVKTMVVTSLGSVGASSGEHYYQIDTVSPSIYKGASFTCNPIATNAQYFTLSSSHSSFYPAGFGIANGISAYGNIYLTNGSSFYITAVIDTDQ